MPVVVIQPPRCGSKVLLEHCILATCSYFKENLHFWPLLEMKPYEGLSMNKEPDGIIILLVEGKGGRGGGGGAEREGEWGEIFFVEWFATKFFVWIFYVVCKMFFCFVSLIVYDLLWLAKALQLTDFLAFCLPFPPIKEKKRKNKRKGARRWRRRRIWS